LSPNTTYYYKVSAFDYNSYDESSMSSVYGYATTSEGGLTATPSNLSLAESLTWISNNAVEGGAYTITLNADESIAPQTLYYNDKSVSITLDGGSVERTVSLSSTGSLFTIYSGVTLTLENNVTLQGRSDNTSSLVQMSGSYWYSSGALVMNDGSKITGNTSYGYGGGVYVSDGTFTMNGGEISGNTSSSSYGGGYGGGVYVSSGTFTMSGGEISGNTVSTTSYYAANGGGVTVSSGTFEMSGGEISGNTAYSSGGGVDVGDGAFTMTGGIVSGNTASHSGGGVYAGSGTFTMSGGAISGNTSGYDGGGVYVISGTFTKQGGTIYGSNADSSLKNTATSGSGHAVYVYSDSKMRNATADSSVNLDSSVSGAAGGWENGSVQISLQPTPTSPTLSNASLLVNESASFSVEYGYNSYAWYWNGEPTGAASYDYYLAANSRTPGIYELSVVVTNSAGKTLSARCRVVINAN
jgi:hypothetical protein